MSDDAGEEAPRADEEAPPQGEVPPSSFRSSQGDDAFGTPGPQGNTELTDFHRLIQALLNEKNAPEILPFQTEVVNSVESALHSQEALVEELSTNQDMELSRIIFSQEVRRVRYALRAYYRARLRKIERFAASILDSADMRGRLTKMEETFCQDYFVAVGKHQKSVVLNHLTESFSSLVMESDLSTTRDMIAKPLLDSHVFCNVLQDIGPVEIDADGSIVDMRQGDMFIVKYEPIAQLVYDGRAVLV